MFKNLINKIKSNPLPDPEAISYVIDGLQYKNDQGITYQAIIDRMADENNKGHRPYGGDNKFLVNKYGFRPGKWFYRDYPCKFPVRLVQTQYNGKQAVKICTLDNQHIGWVPADRVQDAIQIQKTTNYIAFGKIIGGERKQLSQDDTGEIVERIDHAKRSLIIGFEKK